MFGLNLGLAFQVQDDLLDAFGTEAEFGKSIGGDIAACKKTFLYLKALEIASKEQKELLERIYNDTSAGRNEKISKVLQIFDELKIKDIVSETVASYTNAAMKALDEVKVQKPKDELKNLAFLIMKRTA
jgi:geranylgeranyl diphosphate synthase type II